MNCYDVQRALTVPCPACKALPQKPCTRLTGDGIPTKEPHDQRLIAWHKLARREIASTITVRQVDLQTRAGTVKARLESNVAHHRLSLWVNGAYAGTVCVKLDEVAVIDTVIEALGLEGSNG